MGALSPILRRKLAHRARREPGYAEAVEERFGHYAGPPSSGWLWVHAVSLGETRAAALWLRALRAERPDIRVLWTHGTATGRAEGRRHLQPGDAQAWLPWDAPGPVQRFLAHFRPRLGVLMETEVWPQLVAGCRAAQVPLLLANARLNERSWRRARRLPWLAGPAYRGLSGVLAQTAADAQRLRDLGAPVDPPRGQIIGNVKFDVPWHPDPWSLGQRWRTAWQAATRSADWPQGRPMLMLASSREGEEALWCDAWRARRGLGRGAAPLWLVVPRHPQRVDAVEALLQRAGLVVVRRSALGALDTETPAWPAAYQQADVLLGDSLGEMPWYYALAQVALLGGSFAPLGGQNLIEAAACECPVLMGPHTFNFAQAASAAIEAGAAWRVEDMGAAVERALALLVDPAALQQAHAGCRALLSQHAGAAQRCAHAVLRWWDLSAAAAAR
ncbi:3-deoxy-D-manno-octulosonic acid transferase [Tepidimonas sp. HKU77]|uniref:3-deoxy-D-manno-octulosonic acid transferase n=1 Tax=Tepidimonas sp. HKU77 TaxID=3414503 RepID=UPI003C7C7567